MYDTILVPTDGSDSAETAAEAAVGLARRFDATVHGVHVVDVGDVPEDVAPDAAGELTRRGENALATIRDLADDADVAVITEVLETAGSIHEEIVDYVGAHDVDLVAMGTHGRTGLDRLVLGSVTERTLRLSPVGVLTVHEGASFDADAESILVPTDGSDAANAAADHAIALAEAIGASVDVVHVVDVGATAAGDVDSSAVLQALEEAGQAAVDEIVDRASDAGLGTVQASVLSGTPARSILEYADERDVDLVVMGTHGRRGLDRYLLGSVTEKVVRVADRPVLAVSAPDEA